MGKMRLTAAYKFPRDGTSRPPYPEWMKTLDRKISNGIYTNAMIIRRNHYRKIYFASPTWLTEDMIKEMREIYKSAGPGQHVDHIIPLRGPLVCGLHVPWNLQVMNATKNMKKSNIDFPDNPNGCNQLFADLDPHQLGLI